MFENEIGDIRARNPTEQIGKQTHARSVNAGTSAIDLPRRADIGCSLHQFIRVTHGNCQVRAARVTENREVHANELV
jgi:hypothetical protein